jgi:hypothetical protein
MNSINLDWAKKSTCPTPTNPEHQAVPGLAATLPKHAGSSATFAAA